MSILEKGLIIITGPSGVGKTTLLRKLEIKSISIHVKATTRMPRPSEVQGDNFYFITESLFKLEKFLFQYIRYSAYYGIYENQILSAIRRHQIHIITIMDFNIIRQMKVQYPHSKAICISTSPDILETRLRNRLSYPNDPRERILIDNCKEIYNEFLAEQDLFDLWIDNSVSIEKGLKHLKKVIHDITSN